MGLRPVLIYSINEIKPLVCNAPLPQGAVDDHKTDVATAVYRRQNAKTCQFSEAE